MSFSIQKTYAESKLQQWLTANYPDWQIKFPLVNLKSDSGPRIEIELMDGAGFRTTLGGKYFERVPGTMFLELSVPTSKMRGTAELDEVREGVKLLFQEKKVVSKTTGCYFDFHVGHALTKGDVGGRYHYHMVIPYTRHEPAQQQSSFEFI